MKRDQSAVKKSWLVASSILLSLFLLSRASDGQAGPAGSIQITPQVIPGGSIIVYACPDQNADGDCGPGDPLPVGVMGCLRDDLGVEEGCKAIIEPDGAEFEELHLDRTYTPYLRFTGDSEGHYQTTRAVPIQVTDGQIEAVTLGAVYPVHPAGIAVQQELDKVYAAFQGPKVDNEWPYPFVAVIDSNSDEVLYTIPGGPDGIGRRPWGVAVSGDNVYIGSYGEGRISIIDANNDLVSANIQPNGTNFRPTAPAVNHENGWVYFPDERGKRVVILNGESIVAEPVLTFAPNGFSPFEAAVVEHGPEGHTFVSMQDGSFGPRAASVEEVDSQAGQPALTTLMPPPLSLQSSHALGLWPQPGQAESRLFVTYAADPAHHPSPNPNRLAVYSFSNQNPQNLLARKINIALPGDYAEAGLIYDSKIGGMLGAYGGFVYDNSKSHLDACDNPARGGIYAATFEGTVVTGPAPSKVVGNPPLAADNLNWKNPFELALDPANGKVYVTDRCWNEFPAGGQPGGGAILIFDDSAVTLPNDGPTAGQITLRLTGPADTAPGQTVQVSLVAQDVPEPGLYGVQLEINYPPGLISANNLLLNPDLVFTMQQQIDPVAGKIIIAASRQGQVAGLTGDVTLLTFEATAAASPGTATFFLTSVKIGDPQARPFEVTTESYTLVIEADATPEPTVEPTLTPTVEPTVEPTTEPTSTPTTEPTVEPGAAVVSGQISLTGRVDNDWSGAGVTIEDSGQTATTDPAGAFSIADVATGPHSQITADAAGYLPALCASPTITAPTTVLAPVSLLSGDLNDDDLVDATDATTIGVNFGLTGPGLPADLNRDQVVDVFDLILVSANFGEGPQPWPCQ